MALVDVRGRVELSQAGLQELNGLSVIPFKSQLSDFDHEGNRRWSLRVYL